MSSSQEKKRLIRRVRALKKALKRQAQETSTPPPSEAAAEVSAEPEKQGVEGVRPFQHVAELRMEGAALRRPHLYGLSQAKREALAIKNLNKALSPLSPDRIVMHATRNCLMMEAEEQRLLAREAASNTPEPAPQQPVNILVQQNTQVQRDQRRELEETAETISILAELGALTPRVERNGPAENHEIHPGQAAS